ncbi:DNA polymerase III subunit delta' [Carnobacterium funditum]|uniref:DNA polymerase III subunit delta' n=1 Tax=Carnobacterium funditum TaxID=2752 RepID=UPI000A98705B|nr:DNA polymerase III subunit delta' [Carnobacterium funditum]
MIKIENNLRSIQPIIYKQLQKTMEKNQLTHAYLFEGVSGTGKKDMALWVAASLFCQNLVDGLPCQECTSCLRVLKQVHPDVIEIAPDGLSIKVEQVRQLKAEFSKSGVEGQQKVFIIEDAEKMTAGAANSLLKFLEEPNGKAVAFLLTTAKQRLLPTILSRCQLIHFRNLSKQQLLTELDKKETKNHQSALLVQLTNSLETAILMNQDEWFNEAAKIGFKWFVQITNKKDESFVFVQTDIMSHFKERNQYLLLIDLLLLAYRDVLKTHYKVIDILAYPQHEEQIGELATQFNGKDLSRAIEIILQSRKKLESNVNAQGVFEQLTLLLAKD